jgi:hypothetical protein
MQSGDYKDEFYTARGDRGGVVLHLQSAGEGSGAELEDVSESALEALAEEGYIKIGKGGRCTLRPKAYQQYKSLKDPLDLFPTIEELTRHKTSSIDIFISHSSKDREIAEALINLLRDALSIPANKIRCTSVDGYRLQAGASTDDQLRQEIYGARAFIGLITPASLQSNYVSFELGARWGARFHLAPVLAAGVNAGSLRAPLTSLNSLNCDIPAQVHQLVSDIASIIKVSVGSPAAYQKHVDALVTMSRESGEQYQRETSTAQAAAQSVSPNREQLNERDRNLFAQFLKEFPSQGESIRFLREHDIGGRFQASWLDEIYDFLRVWKDAEHEFINTDIENKRQVLWNALNIFVRELHQYASSTHREGWLSIREMIGHEDRGKLFQIQERLNDLATEAYKAHQDLIREGNRHL